MHFEVRNGSMVLFWQDVWCGDSSVKTQVPDLFRMAPFKDAMVHQMFSWNGEHIHWDLSLLSSLTIGKRTVFAISLQCCHGGRDSGQ